MEVETNCPHKKRKFDEENCFEIINIGGCSGDCNHELLWDFQREVLRETLVDRMNFDRFGHKIIQEENSNNIIEITNRYQKDLYKNNTNTILVGHHTRSLDGIKRYLFDVNSFYDVEHKYYGFDTILFKVKNKQEIFCITNQLMEMVKLIIDELSVNLKSDIIAIKIGVPKKFERNDSLLYVETPWFWIIRSGVFCGRFEEEQMKLSQKVEESRQFFKVTDFFNVDWNLLNDWKDQEFQNLIYDLLNIRQSTVEIQAIGKSKAPDRGRDFIYVEKRDTIEGKREFKWLVQCKCSRRTISPSDISGWVERVIEHNVNGYWLVTNNDISPNLYDQFKGIEMNKEYAIEAHCWDRLKIEALLNVYADIYKKYFKNSQ